MDAEKVTEKRGEKVPALIYCVTLCVASGILIGTALNSIPLGFGVFLGLLAIVAAIFFSQDNL